MKNIKRKSQENNIRILPSTNLIAPPSTSTNKLALPDLRFNYTFYRALNKEFNRYKIVQQNNINNANTTNISDIKFNTKVLIVGKVILKNIVIMPLLQNIVFTGALIILKPWLQLVIYKGFVVGHLVKEWCAKMLIHP
ncbi:uncharacterized protein SCODWIG_02802 [Saccharomycodes ludwigii]|uniref:Uncharacterized protein n=1 Tax=Saccharomycodes ludwigii TaxID=36035 RepID=A0A376B8V4_9ASCO|nr:hypothetical protein SCDLUD_002458 [Saccharomycodes ludwigii]KAH3900993.1 hypothetical protein SCDLUD_002458 [Saccharomycodes ludwigii]SSD61041.1 uncharacterized protein SCODWIG_02802 [Saccharomycodes ludwigii]